MSDLLKVVINAHGGLDRWLNFKRVEARLSVGGAMWESVQAAGLFTDVTFKSNLRDQNDITILNLSSQHGGKGRLQSVYNASADKISIVDTSTGEIVNQRYQPRSSFGTGPWDDLQAAYFASYALWNYLTQPFIYRLPGFQLEELPAVEEGGERWRRLKIRYPSDGSLVGHSQSAISYYGATDGLLRRHDYAVDVLAGATGANYAFDIRNANGISVPFQRRVYQLQADGTAKVEGPVLVSIDIESVKFT